MIILLDKKYIHILLWYRFSRTYCVGYQRWERNNQEITIEIHIPLDPDNIIYEMTGISKRLTLSLNSSKNIWKWKRKRQGCPRTTDSKRREEYREDNRSKTTGISWSYTKRGVPAYIDRGVALNLFGEPLGWANAERGVPRGKSVSIDLSQF